MTPKQKLRWEKVKAKGKVRYVTTTAIAFGFGIFLSSLFHEFVWKNNPDTEFWSLLIFLAFSFILPAFCGALGALLYWERSEKKEKSNL